MTAPETPLSPPRLLTPADAPAYVALRRQMLVDTPWAFAADPANDRGSDPVGVAAALARPDYAIAGMFDSARLISTAVCVRESNPKRAHAALIVSVYTDPTFRARGCARAVLSLLIATAATWPGVDALELTVAERATTARRLYESLGFIAWGTQPDALRVDGESFAETWMRLSVHARSAPSSHNLRSSVSPRTTL